MDTIMSQVDDAYRTEERLDANLLAENHQESSSSIVPPRPSVVSNHILVENIGRSLMHRDFVNFVGFYEFFFKWKFGPVRHIYVAKDHESWQPANVAIVTFEDQSDAQKALEASKDCLTIDSDFFQYGIYSRFEWKRILKVSPLEETLISRVRRYVKTRRENNDSEMRELENNVSKLVPGQIEREPFLANQQEWDSIDHGIQILSDDLIREIIEITEDRRDLVSCELVCRRWNAICQDIWFCKKKLTINPIDFFYQHSYGLGFNEAIFSILKRCPNLKSLEIGYLVDELTVEIIGECCPFLEKLINPNLPRISPKFLAKCCPKLKDFCLDFGYCLTETKLKELIREFKNMNSLDVSNNNIIIGRCFRYLSQLRILNVTDTRITRTPGFVNLALGCHSSLRKLVAGRICRDDLSFICESFKNLDKLEFIHPIEAPFSDVLNLISKIETLEELYINSSDRYGKLVGSGSYEEEFISFIQRCRKLRVLNLPYCEDLTDNAICQLADYCKNLEDIRITCTCISDKITNRSYDALSRLTSLKTLSLGEGAVTDEGMEKVFMGCPKLLYLDLGNCPLVTNRTLFTAFDLKERRLLNPRLRIRIRISRSFITIKMNDLKNHQQIHDLKNMAQR